MKKTCKCNACGSELTLPEDGTYLCRDSDGDECLMVLRGNTWYHCVEGGLNDSEVVGDYPPYTALERVLIEDV